ncbi:MAG: phenylalanine--tRNA ligase subunit beta [Pirellulales bacterium]|nr:phenylalanine--tRNA ligase subunit beta [Pirellulales bacterium]
MIVSWDWLKQYVPLDMPVEELERRLMFAGLNHEETHEVDGDLAIDLEVTSNRADCLGHLGIAREVAVLFRKELGESPAHPRAGKTPVESLTSVKIECPELCRQYTARVLRNVRVGASPTWMKRRLATLGVASINNVVDATNYVLFECGQPLHAFDFDRLSGERIVVREPKPGEKLEAIDHKTYELALGMCAICDAEKPVAIGGIMGGASSEVGASTKNLLIEAARFDAVSVRNTARKLNLHSDSSYRFERALDPARVDWASRRCCELIIEMGGGDLAAGVIDVGTPVAPRTPILLRFSQLQRILGIDIERAEVLRILEALGNRQVRASERDVEVIPPTWRADLSREIDLVEEVARIHGYEEISEDAQVPMAASARTDADRVLSRVRQVMTATGFDEAMTLSTVDAEWSEAFSPWTDQAPLEAHVPVLRRADILRRSLIPSLLGARRTNEALANPVIELFEIAKVYLPQATGLPREELMLTLTSAGDATAEEEKENRSFLRVKGTVEALVAALHAQARLEVRPVSRDPHGLFDRGSSCELVLAGDTSAPWAIVGCVSAEGLKRFDLRGPTAVAEVRLSALLSVARLVPQYTPPVTYPAISRDLNLVVDESVRWEQIEQAVRRAAGDLLESLEWKPPVYRHAERLGPGKKSFVLATTFRDPSATMTGEAADTLRDQIVAACRQACGAELRA